MLTMKCPYCGEEMQLGRIYGEGEHAVFWLPDSAEYTKWILTGKGIRQCGGVLLDTPTALGFFSMDKPESYWCENCRIFLTRADHRRDV